MSIPQADPNPYTTPGTSKPTTPPSTESDAPAPPEYIDKRGWLALTCIALGVSIVIMDATIVNVALPVVIKDLGLSAADAQWTNAAYSLVFAALLLTLGRLGDLHGRRRLFISGMILFMAASAVAGASTTAPMLIGSRLVQGLGAAMIVPSTLSTLNAMFSGRARTIAFAVWGSAIGGMAAIGPLIGGWLATDASWRWAFWLNIPIGLLIVTGIIRAVPETRDTATAPGGDPVGVALSALIVQTGLALEALAVAALALTVSTTISTWLICLLLFVYGIGVGMATAQLTALLLSSVPPRQSGQASGIQSTIRQLGSALGVAALGGLLINQLTNATHHNLAALHLPANTTNALTTAVSRSAGTAIAGLQASPKGQDIAQAATNAMITASQTTLWIAAATLSVGLLLTLSLPKTPTH